MTHAHARQMLTLMDDNQRLAERNEKLLGTIKQAHYKLEHHSASHEAMRILAAALHALCAAPSPSPKEEQ